MSSALAELHRAVALRQGSRVRALLQAGCGASVCDARGRNALHVAADAGHVDMMNILLAQPDAAAGVNLRDSCDMTPLHIAASRTGGKSNARRLVAAGADVNATGPFGLRPLACARSCGHADTGSWLTRRGAKPVRDPLPEISFRSLLAHLFGIGGTTRLGAWRVSLESAYPEGTFALLGDALAAGVWQPEPVGSGGENIAWIREAAGALQQAGDNIGVSSRALQSRIGRGATVILPSGLPCHSTACVWVDGRAMWCDRLMQPSVVSISARISRRRIRSLQRSGVAWQGRGVARMARMRMKAAVLIEDGKAGRSPKRQHVGNCAMASAKAALWAVLAMRAEGRAGPPRRLYKLATTYARLHHLREYIARHRDGAPEPPDRALVAACLRKLLALRRRRFLSAEQLAEVQGLQAAWSA